MTVNFIDEQSFRSTLLSAASTLFIMYDVQNSSQILFASPSHMLQVEQLRESRVLFRITNEMHPLNDRLSSARTVQYAHIENKLY